MRVAISLKHYVDCCIGLDCRHTSAVAGCLSQYADMRRKLLVVP